MSLEGALELAARHAGRGYPNPTIGAVVLGPDGAVVGEGVSEPAGGPHAEVVALDAAGEAARGGTLFVTMEPCAHHGRTPPCVERILEAGVSRVVAGCADPNPAAVGGAERLRAAGVDVELLDLPEARGRIEALAALVDVPIQVDGGVGEGNVRALRDAGASLLVAGSSVFSGSDPAEAYARLAASAA